MNNLTSIPTGRHTLSGVDYVMGDYSNGTGFCVVIQIDFKNYMIKEDPFDDYRSFLKPVEVVNVDIRNTFPPQTVFIKHPLNDGNIDLEVIEIESNKGKLILRVGNIYGASGSYYPSAIVNYHPENMNINIGNK